MQGLTIIRAAVLKDSGGGRCPHAILKRPVVLLDFHSTQAFLCVVLLHGILDFSPKTVAMIKVVTIRMCRKFWLLCGRPLDDRVSESRK